mmetsp:Transcript_78620/g.243926  ORF Transcript_78620/g.243926 Transcript_78620/m.243926 type:complete len:278 (+) Transcript_78620:269-1102(+)
MGRHADASLVADGPPEALVHEERSRDARRLLHPKRLHRCTQAAVDDEEVHVPEEDAEVGPLDVQKALLALQRRGLARQPLRDPALLALPHVDEAKVELAVPDHLDGASQHRLPQHGHAAERHDPELRAGRLCLLDEALQRITERAHATGAVAQEDEVRCDDIAPPVPRPVEGVAAHGDDDRVPPSLQQRVGVPRRQGEPASDPVDLELGEGVLLGEGLAPGERLVTAERLLLDGVDYREPRRLMACTRVCCSRRCAMPVQHMKALEQAQGDASPKKN